MSASGDLGAYHVEIKDATLVHDYEENLAMVITYAWTNNSEETTSAMMTILEKAFHTNSGMVTICDIVAQRRRVQ